jgi:hypothetical protein
MIYAQKKSEGSHSHSRKGRHQLMLVLTRCPGFGTKATICIGHDVEVTVLRIDGDQIQLAITAPKTVPIAFGPGDPACFPRVDKPPRRPVY